MSRIKINKPAPDFLLDDYKGNPVNLSSYRGSKNVLLVFNRGFA